jgi:hypothetical protein
LVERGVLHAGGASASRHGEDAELLAIASKLATDLAESIEAAVPTIRV